MPDDFDDDEDEISLWRGHLNAYKLFAELHSYKAAWKTEIIGGGLGGGILFLRGLDLTQLDTFFGLKGLKPIRRRREYWRVLEFGNVWSECENEDAVDLLKKREKQAKAKAKK